MDSVALAWENLKYRRTALLISVNIDVLILILIAHLGWWVFFWVWLGLGIISLIGSYVLVRQAEELLKEAGI